MLPPASRHVCEVRASTDLDLGVVMIERISISGVASYGSTTQALEGLSQFNYIYGPNGAGKTTISKVLADEAKYPSCSVGWANGSKHKAIVYNRDFVDKNFTQAKDLRGIFTLGEGHIEKSMRSSPPPGRSSKR
jgi:hypothetical protein